MGGILSGVCSERAFTFGHPWLDVWVQALAPPVCTARAEHASEATAPTPYKLSTEPSQSPGVVFDLDAGSAVQPDRKENGRKTN